MEVDKKSRCVVVPCMASCSLTAINRLKICSDSKVCLHLAKSYLQSLSLLQEKFDIRVVTNFHRSLAELCGEGNLLLVNLSYAQAVLITSFLIGFTIPFSFLIHFLTT